MIVMNIPATKTTLTESLGFLGLTASGQREITKASRRPAALVVPGPARPGHLIANSRHSCW